MYKSAKLILKNARKSFNQKSHNFTVCVLPFLPELKIYTGVLIEPQQETCDLVIKPCANHSFYSSYIYIPFAKKFGLLGHYARTYICTCTKAKISMYQCVYMLYMFLQTTKQVFFHYHSNVYVFVR